MAEQLGSEKKLRLLILVAKPIQHFTPMYASLSSRKDSEVQVVFTSERPGPYFDSAFGREIDWGVDAEGFDWEFVGGGRRDVRPLIAAIRSFAPDVVVTYGFSSSASIAAITYCRARGIPIAYISDSEDHRIAAPARHLASKALTASVFSLFDAFLAVGDANADYYLRRGVPGDRIVQAPFPIDTDAHDFAWINRERYRRDVRTSLGIDTDQIVIITAGKITNRKNHSELVRAVSTVDPKDARLVVVVAGSGPGEVQTDDWDRAAGSHQVLLPGFVEKAKLPEFLVASDIYIQPSIRDPHPLTVTEAGYCGLPLVVSHTCGIHGPTDDLQPGVNGFVYRLGSPESLSDQIRRLAIDSSLRRQFGEASRQIGLERQARAHGGFVPDLRRLLDR